MYRSVRSMLCLSDYHRENYSATGGERRQCFLGYKPTEALRVIPFGSNIAAMHDNHAEISRTVHIVGGFVYR